MNHTIQQTYKNRAAALRFLREWGFNYSERKFYGDCDKHSMIEPDGKSVNLASLIAYLWADHPPIPTGSEGAEADEHHIREKQIYELRKLKAETETAERKGRREDDAWMEVIDSIRQMAAFGGLVETSLQQQATIKLSELIYLCGGDIKHAAKFSHALDRLFADAMTDAVRDLEVEVEFEAEDQGDAGDVGMELVEE